jgi:hypothetical protein
LSFGTVFSLDYQGRPTALLTRFNKRIFVIAVA